MNFFKSFFSSKESIEQAQTPQQPPTDSPTPKDTDKIETQQSPTSNQCDTQEQFEKKGSDTSAVHSLPDQQTKNTGSSLGAILISLLKGKLGMDVISAVSLPASFYEPLTILQRSCETLAHSPLIDQASMASEAIERLLWIATFGISGYSGSERFYTNFNPLLGETFEYVDKRNGMRFLAEQVCHHPPITASHAENDNFVFWQDTRVKTKFLGNSVDINTQARTHIFLPRTKDHFFYLCPVTRVHNLIIGSLWLEHYGELKIINETTQDTAVVVFKKSGFFETTHYDFEGIVKNAQGLPCVRLFGKWNEAVYCEWLISCGTHKPKDVECLWRVPVPYYDTTTKWRLTPFAYELLKPTTLVTLPKPSQSQTCPPTSSSSSSLSLIPIPSQPLSSPSSSAMFTNNRAESSTSSIQIQTQTSTEHESLLQTLQSLELSPQPPASVPTVTTSTVDTTTSSFSILPQLPAGELTSTELMILAEKVLCPTDSRLRPDRRWLEYGYTDLATTWKRALEERQRLDRRLTEQYASTTISVLSSENLQKTSSTQSTTINSSSSVVQNNTLLHFPSEHSDHVFVPYVPAWFKKIPDGEGGDTWVYTGTYWQQREEKERLLLCGNEEEAKKLLYPRSVRNKACDFRSYQSTSQLPLPPSPAEYQTWKKQQTNKK